MGFLDTIDARNIEKQKAAAFDGLQKRAEAEAIHSKGLAAGVQKGTVDGMNYAANAMQVGLQKRQEAARMAEQQSLGLPTPQIAQEPTGLASYHQYNV